MNKKLLINPFESVSEKKLLVFGIVTTILASYLAFLLNGRFDGAIDLHFTEKVEMLQPLFDNIINFTSLFIFLLIAGKIINPKTRAVDIATPILVAKTPYYILLLFNINNFIYSETSLLVQSANLENPSKMPNINPESLAIILPFALLSIAFLVWFFVLLYYGFKTATNSKTPAHKMCFIGAVILAEVLSSLLIMTFNY